jgi:hypothetical protein
MEYEFRVKFYADAPDGTKNKYMVYKCDDIEKAIELVKRFSSKGWTIRAAYFETDKGANVRIPSNILN